MSLTRVVAMTGCDSGLGYALAARSAREGLVTVAGMLNGTDTAAASSLAKLTAHPYPLDVTSEESVTGFGKYVKNLVEENPGYTLHAVVNNAGIMTIGDYEWQTPKMIQNTVNVNLLGAMRIVTSLLPLLRKSASEVSETITESTLRPRIINVASHCGLHPLPGFGPYSASKAGLLAWTRALRFELRPYGLRAVAFVPGGFIASSNLMSTQASNCNLMLEHLDPEQRSFHGRRITAFGDFFQNVAKNASYDSLTDTKIIESFVKALTDEDPKELYKVESLRYTFYYNLMKLPLPETVHHWLIKKFLLFPED